MEVTKVVSFIKPRIGLIFFVIDNCLIFLLSIYITISLAIKNTLSTLKNHASKEYKGEYLIDEAHLIEN